jgi:hypothetical protein
MNKIRRTTEALTRRTSVLIHKRHSKNHAFVFRGSENVLNLLKSRDRFFSQPQYFLMLRVRACTVMCFEHLPISCHYHGQYDEHDECTEVAEVHVLHVSRESLKRKLIAETAATTRLVGKFKPRRLIFLPHWCPLGGTGQSLSPPPRKLKKSHLEGRKKYVNY